MTLHYITLHYITLHYLVSSELPVRGWAFLVLRLRWSSCPLMMLTLRLIILMRTTIARFIVLVSVHDEITNPEFCYMPVIQHIFRSELGLISFICKYFGIRQILIQPQREIQCAVNSIQFNHWLIIINCWQLEAVPMIRIFVLTHWTLPTLPSYQILRPKLSVTCPAIHNESKYSNNRNFLASELRKFNKCLPPISCLNYNELENKKLSF